MIQLEHLQFSYPGGPAVLRDISMQVKPGEVLGILGPNGSGKTTLLHIMAGLLRPQEGSVRWDGEELYEIKRHDIARRMALVRQEESVSLPFSVWDVVLMGRQPYHNFFGFDSQEDRDIAKAALEATDTTHLATRPIQSLSGGERRRVMIARALAQTTPIIILDEPTAHLDIRFQFEVCELLHRLCTQEKKSIVITLHDINLASLYCDRICLLSSGTIHQEGLPKDVITKESIATVYGVDVMIDYDGDHGRPYYRLERKRS